MLEKLIILFVILLLYIGDNVYGRIGFDMPYNKYLIIIFFTGLILFVAIRKVYHKQFIYYSLFALMYASLRTMLMGIEGTFWLNLLLFAPPVLGYFFYTLYSVNDYKTLRRDISRSVLILYIIECLIAIFERVIGNLVFGWVTRDNILMALGADNEFRSTAIFGHPLQNALIVSTIMAFILFSNIKINAKLWLWFLGYMAILSFNTRSSMVGDALILGFFLLSKMRYSKGKVKIGYFLLSVLGAASILSLLFKTSLGGRLIEMGLVDDSSAQVRINSWSIFDYFSLNDFLWGHSSKEVSYFLYSAGLIVTENFWIDWMLIYGLAIVILYVVFMYYLLRSLYSRYNKTAILGTCSTFWLIASTNNSLSATFIPLLVFILCVILFSPENEKYMFQSLYDKK